MKIWLRLHGFELCSWTFVWENLKNAFEADGDIIHFTGDPPNPKEYIELWWGDPQFWEWSKYKVKGRVALALSEAHSILKQGRENVINNLNEADVIICPSQFASTAFMEAPIDKPIRIAFFGVAPDEFKYIDRDWSGNIKFLHGGVSQFRKGSWLVPEAFLKCYNQVGNVELTIATPKVTPMFAQMKLEYGSHPNIHFISNIQDSASKLYENHHVYISPHLSEGFGLMIPEAMATGMPCLVSRCSSPREYFSSEYGWWIEMSELYASVEQCLPDTAGFWRIPDVNSLVENMIECAISKKEAEEKGKKASDYVLNNLTWLHTIKKIKSIIKEFINE